MFFYIVRYETFLRTVIKWNSPLLFWRWIYRWNKGLWRLKQGIFLCVRIFCKKGCGFIVFYIFILNKIFHWWNNLVYTSIFCFLFWSLLRNTFWGNVFWRVFWIIWFWILDFWITNWNMMFTLTNITFLGLVQFWTTCPTRKQLKHLVLLIRICFQAWTSVTNEHLLLRWFYLQQVNEIWFVFGCPFWVCRCKVEPESNGGTGLGLSKLKTISW